ITPNRLAEGYGAVIKYQCANRVCESGTNVPVVLVRSFNGKSDTLTTHTIPIFAGHSSVSFSDSISTFGLLGNVLYTVTVNPNQALNEQLAFNNSASANLSVLRDSLKPRLDLIFDGHHINSGDFVSSKVQINARLFDQNAIRVTDTASIGMMLVRLDPPSTIPIFFKGSFVNDSLTSTFSSLPTGAIQANLLVDPTKPIIAGTYSLTAFASDASGNRADTIETEFVISGKQGVDRVMNYPNPFKDKTSFTFILQSAEQASVKVVVYTIAGRKIRTLYLDPAHQRVGLNAVEWDGRDENGNEIANGTYLYKLVMSGKNDDGSDASDAVLERAVKSR
ncbi:MAG TPA: FlgD immunoglobulin-like domain containing protein, partial [Candidatus Kapabacteria bacterium]|nr:FlgD immunoglobulin-like domain containing protein [Candidatus Kapabacteria bacterium]